MDKLNNTLDAFMKKFDIGSLGIGIDIEDKDRITLLERSEKRIEDYLNKDDNKDKPRGEKAFNIIDKDTVEFVHYENGERKDLTIEFGLNEIEQKMKFPSAIDESVEENISTSTIKP